MSYESYDGDDDTAELPRRRRARRVGTILLGTGVVVVLIGCGAAVTLLKGSGHEPPAASRSEADGWSTPIASYSAPASDAAAADVETSPAPPSRTPSPTRKPAPKATETVKPPAPRHTEKPGCAPSRGPDQLPKATVRGYLDKAATTHFWGTKTNPDFAPILVPQRLLYAIAEQESGWQSDIKACDGGLGLMQIMPSTQQFVNYRFGVSWDRTKPYDNVMLGANYLAWLIAYYAPLVGTYDMTDAKLLNAVISAYNWGTDGVDWANQHYPNPDYVSSVRALMLGSHAGNY